MSSDSKAAYLRATEHLSNYQHTSATGTPWPSPSADPNRSRPSRASFSYKGVRVKTYGAGKRMVVLDSRSKL